MAKFKFKLDKKGVSALLSSEEMKKIIEEYGNNALAKCDKTNSKGEAYNYELKVGVGRTRVHANINCGDYEAYYHNLKTNTLIKAIK